MKHGQLSKYQKLFLAGLFLVFLLVGISSADDYGIAWDEPAQMEIGQFNYEYLTGKSDTLVNYHDRFYGAAYEMPLYALQKFITNHSNINTFHIRHLITHLLFIVSLGFFFALLFRLFKSFNAASLGVIMLYIHPRIFAHSFFNSKDIVFMSVFIIGLFSLYLLFEKQSKKRILFHALLSALLIDIRILGIILPFLTLLMALPLLFKDSSSRKEVLKTASYYSLLLIIFIYIFWPALWTDFALLGKSFARMSHFPFRYNVLFQGELIPAYQIPWDYAFTWITITTPPFILLLFILGFVWQIVDYLKNPEGAFNSNTQWFKLVLISFPIDFIIIIIIINSTLYDGWRQLYFLYPLLLISSVIAFSKIEQSLKNRKIGLYIFRGFLFIFIALTILKIYKLHPYEQVYFNHFVSKKDNNRSKKFEMDYWGLSYREGLEYICKHDDSDKISVYFANAAGVNNILILPDDMQQRIKVSENIEDADYFITNYRYHPDDYDFNNKIHEIIRDENRILSVFKLEKKQ